MKEKLWNKYTRSGLIVLVGVIFALIGFKLTQSNIAQHVQTQRVIVAKEDIAPFTELTKDMLEYEDRVISAIPSGAINDASQISFGDAYTSEFGIIKGSTLQAHLITTAAQSQMGSLVSLKPGYTEIGVKTDLVLSAGDEAKPGVLVDVIAYVQKESESIKVSDPSLTGIRVLKRLNSEGTVPDPNAGNSLIPVVVVLEVTKAQAESIMEYQESGKVYLLPTELERSDK
ncbi:Flp pilus assembly protein CpaB [Fontibacillus solani]|uniref:Flp pilus assembly protein CpaB n=1 Tax=Fontibacillus solani TaxID=1572857 RepID=A0A7W3SUH4_9BACL|nr:RcpC/CpaB family pilus assembly protein [Fontibacillus solani]MBA9086491.1 Flp pilus assembly protein CpaB [Fontibacillus solani]